MERARNGASLGVALASCVLAFAACGRTGAEGETDEVGGSPSTKGAGGRAAVSLGAGGRLTIPGGTVGAGGGTAHGSGGAPFGGRTHAGGAAAAAPTAGSAGSGGDVSVEAGVRDAAADANPASPEIVGVYVEGDVFDVRVHFPGAPSLPDYVQLPVDLDGAHDAGVYWNDFERTVTFMRDAGSTRLIVSLDGYRSIELDACEYAAYDPATGTLDVRVPRAYIERDRLPLVGLAPPSLNEPTSLVSPVPGPAPALSGKPLCNTMPLRYVAGTYIELWAMVGLGPAPRLCTLSTAGEISCFADLGQPAYVTPAGPFDQIGPKLGGLCGRRPSGELACWQAFSMKPLQAPDGTRYKMLSRSGSCAVLSTDALRCDTFDGSVVFERAGPYVAVSGTHVAGCAIRDSGALDCWHGNDSPDDPVAPVELFTGKYREIADAGNMFCAISVDGSASCAIGGQDRLIRLDGADYVHLVPSGAICAHRATGITTCVGTSATFPSGRFKEVVTGEYVYPDCAILMDGRLACWNADAAALP